MTDLAHYQERGGHSQPVVVPFDQLVAEAKAQLATMTPEQQEAAAAQLHAVLQTTGLLDMEPVGLPAPDTLRGQYLRSALARAIYTTYDDGTVLGEIPATPGVLVNEPTQAACAEELAYALDSWITVGLRHGDPLPVVGGIDLNPRRIT